MLCSQSPRVNTVIAHTSELRVEGAGGTAATHIEGCSTTGALAGSVDRCSK